MISILCADDHPVVRIGIREIIRENLDEVSVTEAVDGYETLKQVLCQSWSLIVLDDSMPGPSGAELVREIRKARLSDPILILGLHSEASIAAAFRQAGADGYITKTSPENELVNAVRCVLNNGSYWRFPWMGIPDIGAQAPAAASLSRREMRVLTLMAKGKTVREIGSDLHLSSTTIRKCKHSVAEKIKGKSDAELIRIALGLQLIK